MSERWRCPVCGMTVELFVPAHGRPCCPSATCGALMVRVDGKEGQG